MEVQATFLFETFLVRKHIDTEQNYYGKAIKCHIHLATATGKKHSFKDSQTKIHFFIKESH